MELFYAEPPCQNNRQNALFWARKLKKFWGGGTAPSPGPTLIGEGTPPLHPPRRLRRLAPYLPTPQLFFHNSHTGRVHYFSVIMQIFCGSAPIVGSICSPAHLTRGQYVGVASSGGQSASSSHLACRCGLRACLRAFYGPFVYCAVGHGDEEGTAESEQQYDLWPCHRLDLITLCVDTGVQRPHTYNDCCCVRFRARRNNTRQMAPTNLRTP